MDASMIDIGRRVVVTNHYSFWTGHAAWEGTVLAYSESGQMIKIGWLGSWLYMWVGAQYVSRIETTVKL